MEHWPYPTLLWTGHDHSIHLIPLWCSYKNSYLWFWDNEILFTNLETRWGKKEKNQASVAMEEVENFPGSKKKPQIPHLPPYKTALATIPPGVWEQTLNVKWEGLHLGNLGQVIFNITSLFLQHPWATFIKAFIPLYLFSFLVECSWEQQLCFIYVCKLKVYTISNSKW